MSQARFQSRCAHPIFEPLEARQLLSTYYVSPAGSDANDGLSQATAWKTLSNVNAQSFAPGDVILLQGGASFSGTVHFGSDDKGAPGAPIRVSSYGSGRATIASGTEAGLEIHNTEWFEISKLNIAGSGRDINSGDGLTAWQDGQSSTRLHHLYIDDVEVRGYGRTGIAIGGDTGSAGFEDVRITHTVVRDNGFRGIFIWGDSVGRNQGIYIGHVTAFNNSGIAGASYPSGDGIVVSASRRAKIERSIAYNNGFEGNGGIGIWAFDSDIVTIQYNESYNNRTAGTVDGGGFALDGGVTNSRLQYNYSHGNDGAGYGLYQYSGARAWKNNKVRYNISENDGRKNSYGAITTWNRDGSNGLNGCTIHNNTIYLSPASRGSPAILRFMSGGTVDFRIHNNIFTTSDGAHFTLASSAQTNLKIQGNNYWTSGGNFTAAWNGVTYGSLTDWQRASGQEILDGVTVARQVDPGVKRPFGGGTIGNAANLRSLTAYALMENSALIDGGLNLESLGISAVRDFWGTPAAQRSGFSIGAHEFVRGRP